MSVNDCASWNWDDPCPSAALDQIAPLSLRATSLIARSHSPLLQQHFMQLAGVVAILSGLEYHFGSFQRHVQLVQFLSPAAHSELRHEAVAWVNRVGQLHYFVTSQLVKDNIQSAPTPAIDEVLPFRNKHTAHRSADFPRKTDTDHLKTVHEMSLSILGGSLWTPRHAYPGPDISPTSPSSNHFLTFQIQEPVGTAHNLIIEQAHPAVLLEGYSVLEALLA
jgi:hypothetical protein